MGGVKRGEFQNSIFSDVEEVVRDFEWAPKYSFYFFKEKSWWS